jgi:hypothetical protein
MGRCFSGGLSGEEPGTPDCADKVKSRKMSATADEGVKEKESQEECLNKEGIPKIQALPKKRRAMISTSFRFYFAFFCLPESEVDSLYFPFVNVQMSERFYL